MTHSRGIRLLVLGAPELEPFFRRAGFEVLSYENISTLLSQARGAEARACVISPSAFDLNTERIRAFIGRLRREMPFTDVVAWAPKASPENVRDILMQGVKDIVVSDEPAQMVERLAAIIDKQKYLPRMLSHRSRVADKWQFEGILSRSQKMRDIFEVCVRTAGTDATVLIFGETGTGKELLARAFHRRSVRTGRLVALNCAAVPENLIDSELFGHVKGAFTGASGEKTGLFRYAEGGTLFLDEIGHIPLQVQYRLLRVLQEGHVRPVGSDKELPVDVRVIAATSVRLDEAVEAGTFREDLLYRLDVIRVAIPPLRERPEDILFLFGHFSKKLSKHYNFPRPEIHDSFLDAMQAYEWPGNVRQLENFTERLLLTHSSQERLTEDHFGALVAPVADSELLDAVSKPEEEDVPEGPRSQSAGFDSNRTDPQARPEPMPSPLPIGPGPVEPDLDIPLNEAVGDAVERTERAYIERALGKTNGRIAEAAALLGISRRTMQRKMTLLGIDKRDFRSSR